MVTSNPDDNLEHAVYNDDDDDDIDARPPRFEI